MKYSEAEIQRGRYAVEKICKIIEKGPFDVMFDAVAGLLIGYAAKAGYSPRQAVDRISYLIEHDSPDGRTAGELIVAFDKDKVS